MDVRVIIKPVRSILLANDRGSALREIIPQPSLRDHRTPIIKRACRLRYVKAGKVNAGDHVDNRDRMT